MEGVEQRWSEAVVVGTAIYVLIDVVLVFLRPQFSVLHNAESDYGSAGPWGWVMDVNFLLRGLIGLTLVGALALAAARSGTLTAALGLLGVWAIGSGLLAFFPDDPAGTTLQTSGRVHLALAAVEFLAMILASFVTLRALRADARFDPIRMRLRVLAWAGVVAILLLGKAGIRDHSLGGLWEKIFLACELGWGVVLALRLRQLEPRREQLGPPQVPDGLPTGSG
jgi:hypothetical membrane protein